MPIGGYGRLELPDYGSGLHNGAVALQSGRACLYLHLKHARPDTIYLPDFICEDLLPAIDSLQVRRNTYTLDENLLPELPGRLPAGSSILLVNYFGLLSDRLAEFLREGMPARPMVEIIVDNSQALFSAPLDHTTSFYSPRKFLGIPDGGYLYSSLAVEVPEKAYPGERYMAHLVLRASGSAEAGYPLFRRSEEALGAFEPMSMSAVSRRLVRGVDMDRVRERRRTNFLALESAFGGCNLLRLDLGGQTPLCYPLMTDQPVDKSVSALAHAGIYLPRYWPGCMDETLGPVSEALAHRTLYLPIDQSLDNGDMNFLIDRVRDCL